MFDMNGEQNQDEGPIVEPNRMSEIYRRFQPAAIPLAIEKHLNFIEIADDGCMLLGSSTLNGRYWTGSIHYFTEATSYVHKNACLTGMNCQSVTTDGKFVDSKDRVVIIGEDTGCISLLGLSEIDDENGSKSTHVIVKVSTYDHDSAVLSLSVSPSKSNCVSGSSDQCIKVWDTVGLVTQYTFRPAHCHIISSVQYSLNDDNVFASCSLDGFALMWDTRLEKPATVVKKSDGEGLTSVAWCPLNDNTLAIGSNYGSISLFDVRSLNQLSSTNCFNRPVHKIVFNSAGLLAACGDNNEVRVLELNNNTFNSIYNDTQHDYFVRGLSWHPQRKNELYSCGWDKKVVCHNIRNN